MEVDLRLEPGSLTVTVPVTDDVTLGTVTLVNPAGSSFEKELEFNGNEGKAVFDQLTPTTWAIKVALHKDGTVIASGEEVIQILPGRAITAQVDAKSLSQGGLVIIISLEVPPGKPEGLLLKRNPNSVELVWDHVEGAEGYAIYRSEQESGSKRLLTDHMINGNGFVDQDVDTSGTYFYWVQAINSSGLGGPLAGPVFADAFEPIVLGRLVWEQGQTPVDSVWTNYEIWVLPIRYGDDSISRGSVERLRTVVDVSADGEFSFDRSQLSHAADDYVLLVANPTLSDRSEHIQAVITMDARHTIVSHFPLMELQGALDFGTVALGSWQARASKSLEDNWDAFPSYVVDEMVTTDYYNEYMPLIINDYLNYRNNEDYYYASIWHCYVGPREAVLSGTLTAAADLWHEHSRLCVYTPDGTTRFTFRTPSGIMQDEWGNKGPQSSIKWVYRTYDGLESGWYTLLNHDSGAELARFLVGNPDGSPPRDYAVKPLVELETNEKGEIIGMWLEWILETDGMQIVLEPSWLELLVPRDTMWIQCLDTFMFDRSGAPSMSGDFTYVTFDTPWTWPEGCELQIGFDFGTARFMISYW
ncbi:MAG: fibronectin type III domain-containing protein [Firmicutes bacterium]|nr:fibronectin type III domain-containing protein [Bacillota bacterium]